MKTEYIDRVPIYTYLCAYAIDKNDNILRVMRETNGELYFSDCLFYNKCDEITEDEVKELQERHPEYKFKTYMNTTI